MADSAGVTATSIETQYVSFITATPSLNGNAAAAVIAGVVVAPALVASLQTIADAAAGKTLQQISDKINTVFGLKKALLTPGDLQTLAKYLIASIDGGVVAGVLLKPITIGPLWTETTILANVPSLTITSNSTSSSQLNSGTPSPIDITTTTSDEPAITAIVKPPYTNWLDIQQIITPTTTVPDQDSTSGAPRASCTASNTSIDPGIANELASIFYNGTDLTISENWNIGGSSLNPPVSITSGIYIHFHYTALDGYCGLSCVDSYNQMIKSKYIFEAISCDPDF